MHFWNATNGGLVSHVWWPEQKPDTKKIHYLLQHTTANHKLGLVLEQDG